MIRMSSPFDQNDLLQATKGNGSGGEAGYGVRNEHSGRKLVIK